VGYVIAAYGLVLGVLALYGIRLAGARRELRKSPSTDHS
jgi:hypothetical protein